jgi:Protein of unknown function (DUF3017)
MTSEIKHASTGNHRVRNDGGIVGVIPYLVVLVCVLAGLYIAWSQGSAGGKGAVVGGIALLIAALVRLALPARLAGLLGTRKRVTDVLTLAVIGAGLIIAGLVLPRLGSRPASAAGLAAAVAGPATGRRVSVGGARQVS